MNMGERDDVETIRLGRKAFDGRRAIANLLVEYLELFSHAVLFAFGGYPSTAFAPVNYCDVIVHKCTDKEVQTYVDTCMRTVHRWLQYAKLSKFSAAIRDENDETVVEYMVIVSRAFYTGAKRMWVSYKFREIIA
ncbi:hypothetical protein Tcan_07327 [Toxocara canis]|uniref:HORMA domain-containing protein n=3 Tax=Toxocara canis TaxID=6265 RepID=A0A0B2VLG6_TOXCA|nr:hypothetical protein Tcan_07327 [Toxocara canis]